MTQKHKIFIFNHDMDLISLASYCPVDDVDH